MTAPDPVKKRVLIEVRKIVAVERDFTFPVYSRFWCHSSMIYIRTDADLSHIEVSVQDAGYNDDGGLVDERASIEFGKGTGWLPGGGSSEIEESTAEEFAEAVAKDRAISA